MFPSQRGRERVDPGYLHNLKFILDFLAASPPRHSVATAGSFPSFPSVKAFFLPFFNPVDSVHSV
jgi:hypothetical protein